jgi:diguanylate cyclase (GGDEF)-like protein
MRIESKPVDARERRILVVDDDDQFLAIISEALSWEGYQIKAVTSGDQALTEVQSWRPDLCILDVSLQGKDATETLRELKLQDPFMVVMFISGNTSSEAVIAGLDSGADDFLPKPFDPLELLARIRTQFRIKDLNNQLRIANSRLQELIDIDDLTGLHNMRSVYQKIEQELERCRRFGRHCCVVMMDMDFFKTVNDGHDHLFGSFVLAEVGKIIADSIRNIDLGARYGGDEFLIMLTETTAEGAAIFCERLRHTIENVTFRSEHDEIKLTASLGYAITSIKDNTTDAKTLVRLADNALYESKRAGRNQVRFTEIPDFGVRGKLPASATTPPRKKAG